MSKFIMTEAGLALVNEQRAAYKRPTMLPYDEIALEINHSDPIGLTVSFRYEGVEVANYPQIQVTKFNRIINMKGIIGGLPFTIEGEDADKDQG